MRPARSWRRRGGGGLRIRPPKATAAQPPSWLHHSGALTQHPPSALLSPLTLKHL